MTQLRNLINLPQAILSTFKLVSRYRVIPPFLNAIAMFLFKFQEVSPSKTITHV